MNTSDDENLRALKELFEQRVRALEKETGLVSNQMERRLEGMNEFRDQLKDQAATFITRKECEVVFSKLSDDIKMLRDSKLLLEGKASQFSVNIATLISIIGLTIALVSVVNSMISHQ